MKKIVLFGSSHIVEENLHLQPCCIVDNNPDLQGTVNFGLDIKSPSMLDGKSEQYEVIVCCTSISEVRKQLINYGYDWGSNAYATGALEEVTAIADLEDLNFTFLISSGLPSSAESFSGGGIHIIKEDGDYPVIDTLYEGNTHGLIRLEEGGFAFTCQGKGIVVMSDSYDVIKQIPIPKGLRPHGLRQYKDNWVVVCSHGDCILGVNDKGEELFSYTLSDKIKNYGSAQHHCNDVDILGDYAYISMFSVSGNWKRSVFDGGIVEFDMRTGSSKVLLNNLTMPHSISFVDDVLFVLDSFKGQLLGNNFKKLAQLPGFVRGFSSNSQYYFLGESKNRNFSRLSPERSPVSIDSRITIINKKYSFSRSIPLPQRISEIHSLINIDAFHLD